MFFGLSLISEKREHNYKMWSILEQWDLMELWLVEDELEEPVKVSWT